MTHVLKLVIINIIFLNQLSAVVKFSRGSFIIALVYLDATDTSKYHADVIKTISTTINLGPFWRFSPFD
jgi:hypothetical protein